MPNIFALGSAWLPTMIFRVAKCSRAGRSRTITAPGKPFAKPPRPSCAPSAISAPIIGARNHKSVPPKPPWPPPTRTCPERSRRIARTVYHMLKFKVEYQAMSADEYDQQFEARELKRLQRKAAHFGLSLVPLTAAKEAVS